MKRKKEIAACQGFRIDLRRGEPLRWVICHLQGRGVMGTPLTIGPRPYAGLDCPYGALGRSGGREESLADVYRPSTD